MILLIDNYDSFTFNLVQFIGELGADPLVHRNDALTVEDARELRPRGIIISPGPGRPEDAGISVELVRELADSLPVLGVCLGHQSIAMAYGGTIGRAPHPVHGKSDAVRHSGGALFADVTSPFEAGRYHSLIVERSSLPDCLEIEAENEDGIIMALRHREHPAYGVQFHPESILTGDGKRLLLNFLRLTGEIQ